MSANAARDAWEAAYRQAEYRVGLPAGELVLKVGVHDAENDRRLCREAGVRGRWAIVTPCNPDSRRLPDPANAERLIELAAIVANRELRCVGAVNRDPAGRWPDEPGVLLCDPPPGLAEELGRRFAQNAILAAALGEAPRLVWLTG